MKNIGASDTIQLLSCFVAECEKQFSFLEDEFEFTAFSGIVTYRNNHKVIVPSKTFENIAHPFSACARYEKNDWAIELIFEEENTRLDHYFYHKGVQRFKKDDLLKTAKKARVFKALEKPMNDEETMAAAIKEFAEFLKRYKSWVVGPDEKFIERAVVMKEKLLEQQLREKLEKNLREISEMAAKAYMQKNFRKVIELLTPYKPLLTGADLKKLSQARENIQASIPN